MPLYRRYYKFLDGDYGDITVASGGTALNIDAGVVGASELATSVDMTGKTWSNGTWDSLTANTLLTVAGNLTFSGSSRRITGDFSNGTLANRGWFQTSTANSFTIVGAIPSGTSTVSAFMATEGSDPNNAGYWIDVACSAGDYFDFNKSGTGTARSFEMRVSGTTYFKLFQTGRVFVGPSATDDGLSTLRVGGACTANSLFAITTAGFGYYPGLGTGGTVTQLTSKATGVTLSKACGDITMNNAALAADTTVSFTLTNTAIAATDQLILSHQSGGTLGSYTLNAACAAGSATIYVRNVTTGSLSEAIVIRFTLIKSAQT